MKIDLAVDLNRWYFNHKEQSFTTWDIDYNNESYLKWCFTEDLMSIVFHIHADRCRCVAFTYI